MYKQTLISLHSGNFSTELFNQLYLHHTKTRIDYIDAFKAN